MKIFVDTNIFLDILLKRDNYDAGITIFKAVKNRVYDGVIADISIVNIDYISRKVDVDIKGFLSAVEKSFSILGADNTMVQKALKLDNRDLEDNIQYCLAVYEECDCIVSNDKNFYRGDIEVLDSSEFVFRYLRGINLK